MGVSLALFSAILAYLIGSISFSRLVARIVDPSVDLENTRMKRSDGSQGSRLATVGATTASVKLGPKVGCSIGLLGAC
jgi:glycerol-3-phosphate acyltransferase PlsY